MSYDRMFICQLFALGYGLGEEWQSVAYGMDRDTNTLWELTTKYDMTVIDVIQTIDAGLEKYLQIAGHPRSTGHD